MELFLFAEVQGQVPQIPPASQEAKGARFRFTTKGHYGAASQAEFEAPDLSPAGDCRTCFTLNRAIANLDCVRKLAQAIFPRVTVGARFNGAALARANDSFQER